eukprot:5939400-Prymnesium_polylepis.1
MAAHLAAMPHAGPATCPQAHPCRPTDPRGRGRLAQKDPAATPRRGRAHGLVAPSRARLPSHERPSTHKVALGALNAAAAHTRARPSDKLAVRAHELEVLVALLLALRVLVERVDQARPAQLHQHKVRLRLVHVCVHARLVVAGCRAGCAVARRAR